MKYFSLIESLSSQSAVFKIKYVKIRFRIFGNWSLFIQVNRATYRFDPEYLMRYTSQIFTSTYIRNVCAVQIMFCNRIYLLVEWIFINATLEDLIPTPMLCHLHTAHFSELALTQPKTFICSTWFDSEGWHWDKPRPVTPEGISVTKK